MKGERGENGQDGKRGSDGPRGVKGMQGESGPKGTQGRLGSPGLLGKRGPVVSKSQESFIVSGYNFMHFCFMISKVSSKFFFC